MADELNPDISAEDYAALLEQGYSVEQVNELYEASQASAAAAAAQDAADEAAAAAAAAEQAAAAAAAATAAAAEPPSAWEAYQAEQADAKDKILEDEVAVLNAEKNTGLLEDKSADDSDYIVDTDTGAVTTTEALTDQSLYNDAFTQPEDDIKIEGVATNASGELYALEPDVIIAPDPVQYDPSDFVLTDEEMGFEEIVIEGVGTKTDGSLYVEAPDLPEDLIVLPNEEPDPEWLAQKEQLSEDASAESDQAYAEQDQTEAEYVALKEEREAIEAAIAAGEDTVTLGEGAAAVEFSASVAEDILKTKEKAEAEALQVASDARMAAIEADEAAQEAGADAEEAEQFYEDIAESQEAVYGSDIMQGGDVGADSLAELAEAALQARETLTTAVQDIDATERQVDSLEELAQEAEDLYVTSETAYKEVQDEVKKEADKEGKETAALIAEFTGEDGFGEDDQGNITIGENIDTEEEAEALAAAIDEQLADVNALLTETTEKFVDPDGPTQYDDAGNPISGMDAGVTVEATNVELLGAEAISDLEAQKESLESLQGDLLAATELINASDALIKAGGDPHAKAMQSFWSNAPKYDPKAQFRFKVIIGGNTNTGMALQDALGGGRDVSPSGDPYNDIPDDTGGSVWYAKSVDKPTIQFAKFGEGWLKAGFDVSEVEPLVEAPTFSPISMTLVDPTYPNATRKLLRWIRRSGFMDKQVNKTNQVLRQSPVDAFMNSIGDVQIQQLDSDGKVLEIWQLQEAFPAEINFGKLDYSSSDFVEINITWVYKSVKVLMMVKGAEEEFEYFSDYQSPVRAAAGEVTPCEALHRKSGTSKLLDVWRNGLPRDDDCYLPKSDTRRGQPAKK